MHKNKTALLTHSPPESTAIELHTMHLDFPRLNFIFIYFIISLKNIQYIITIIAIVD